MKPGIIFYMKKRGRDGSIVIAIPKGAKFEDHVSYISKGNETYRIRMKDIVFAYILDNGGDPIETPELPLQPYYAYKEKLELFALEKKEAAIAWLVARGKELGIGNQEIFEYMLETGNLINWENYARLFQVSGMMGESRGLIGPDTFPLLLAMAFAEKRKLDPPFNFQAASLSWAEVHKEHFLFF